MIGDVCLRKFEDVCVRLWLLLVAASWAHRPRNLQAKAFPPVRVSELLEGLTPDIQTQRREMRLPSTAFPEIRALREASAMQQAAYGMDLLALLNELQTCRLEELPLSDRSLQALKQARGAQQPAPPKAGAPLPHANCRRSLPQKQLIQFLSPGLKPVTDVPMKLLSSTVQGERGVNVSCFQDERLGGNGERAQGK